MPRLLLIGASGLDWAGFDAATRSGRLTELAALRARGVAGWLAGAPVSDGPAAWASIATGLQPEVHGVWREQEEWPGGLRASGKASWRVNPVWARLAAAWVSTASVAWPASRPGADWPGVHIDDRFPQSSAREPQDWALPRRCVPDDVRDTMRTRRVHPSQISGAMLVPFVPARAAIDPARDDVLPALAVGLARAATIQSAAVWMLEEVGVEALFVHQPCIGQARAAFERRGEAHLQEVIPAAWRFVDALVGRLAALAGQDALILIVSPGWGGAPGVVLAAGDGVGADPDFLGGSLLDIAPTVLARFGLEDVALPGRRLISVAGGGPLAPAPSPKIEPPARADAALVYALRRRGYRPPPRPSRAWRAQGLADLALMMLDRDPAGAGKAAQAALLQDPVNVTALRVRVRAHVALEEADPLPALGDALLRAAPDRGWGPLAHGAYHVLRNERSSASPWLLRAESDSDVGTLLTTAAVWFAASRPGGAERVFKAILAKEPSNASAEVGLAVCAAGRRDFMAAEASLTRALKQDPGRPAIYLQFAQVYARTARKAEAARAAEIAVRLGARPAMAAAAVAGRLRA